MNSNSKIFVKAALALVIIAVLVYWREVWAWADAKTWDELTADILGFVLKWFFLAIFGFLAATIPHYVTPYLKLFRINGQRRLRDARRGSASPAARNDIKPRVNKDALLMAFIEREMQTKKGGRRG